MSNRRIYSLSKCLMTALLLSISACQKVPREIQIRIVLPSTPPTTLSQANTDLQTNVVIKTPSPGLAPTQTPGLIQTENVDQAEPTTRPAVSSDPATLTSATPSQQASSVQSQSPGPSASTSPQVMPSNTPTPTPTPSPAVVPSPSPMPSASPSILYSPPTENDQQFSNSLGMSFRKLPAGQFIMGSSIYEDGRQPDETEHEVTLNEFWIQSTEVTQAQWEAVMGDNPSYFPNSPLQPVEMVSWNDAERFLYELNQRGEGTYRLPTEAEWEYAARAGQNTAYTCGNDSYCLLAIAWYLETTGGNKTRDVASKQPNDWGLYDMHGNVSEWVQDWYGEYPTETQTQPTGPAFGSQKVNRGGSWSGQAANLRSAKRTAHSKSSMSSKLGFRVVFEP